MAPTPPSSSPTATPDDIRLLTLNCWGLSHLSAQRAERLAEIGRQIASPSPPSDPGVDSDTDSDSDNVPPDIVCLQECWVRSDFEAIRAATAHRLPHARLYRAGVVGTGLAILSRWPVVETDLRAYPLNGRPSAFFRGDWYAGKGVASALIRFGPGDDDLVHVFNTHTHAPYGSAPHSQYTLHRTAQAWLLAKLLRAAAAGGTLVVAMGDFNMLPRSLAHRLITSHAPVRDVWRLLYPHSSLGPAKKAPFLPPSPETSCPATTTADSKIIINIRDPPATSHSNGNEKTPPPLVPSARHNLRVNGITSDGPYNTWRWSRAQRSRLATGDVCPVDPTTPDPDGQRLDYIFFSPSLSSTSSSSSSSWHVVSASVAMTQRHPRLLCSLSDHFAVRATLRRRNPSADNANDDTLPTGDLDDHRPSPQLYDDMLAMLADFTAGESAQQSWRACHFGLALLVWLVCLLAAGLLPPRRWLACLLVLVASLGLAAGLVDGLIALLFFRSELRALDEFEWDIRHAKARCEEDSRSALDHIKKRKGS